MAAVQRVSVVGCAGAGKSRLARRLARRLGVPYVELDAIHHLPGWQPIEPDEFIARLTAVAAEDAWVVDGNYRVVTMDGPVWRRADTVVWLDLPRRTVMRHVVTRTLRRAVTHEELWNGNREPVRNLWSWDPQRSIVCWAWTHHGSHAERYRAAMTSPAYAHLDFVRLRSHAEAERWLRGLTSSVR